MRLCTPTCVVLGAVFLVACDNVEITAQWDPQMSLLQDESPAGIYRGAFTDTSGAVPRSRPVTAIIDTDGNVQIIFTVDSERHVAGRVDVNGDRLTGTLTEYFGAFANFAGISGIGEFALSGDIDAGAGITGVYTAETHAGHFALDYQKASDTASSVDLMAGVWSFSTATAGGVSYTTTWEIDESGVVFGTDTLGCVYVGSVGVGDPLINAYGIAVQVGSCGYFDGDYSGLAYLRSAGGQDLGWLTLGMANDVFAYATVLQR